MRAWNMNACAGGKATQLIMRDDGCLVLESEHPDGRVIGRPLNHISRADKCKMAVVDLC